MRHRPGAGIPRMRRPRARQRFVDPLSHRPVPRVGTRRPGPQPEWHAREAWHPPRGAVATNLQLRAPSRV